MARIPFARTSRAIAFLKLGDSRLGYENSRCETDKLSVLRGPDPFTTAERCFARLYFKSTYKQRVAGPVNVPDSGGTSQIQFGTDTFNVLFVNQAATFRVSNQQREVAKSIDPARQTS